MKIGNAKLLQLAIVAAAIVALCTSDAMARSRGSWGSYGGYGSSGSYASYGSYGSYGSSGSYASYSYSSSGSYGSRPGLFARWHARKAARAASHGSYGSYGSHGSYGSYGSSSYGSYGGYSYSVSYASSGSHGSYGSSSYYAPVGPAEDGVIYDDATPTPAVPTAPAPPATPETAEPSAASGDATIYVNLPAEAKVFVNDRATVSTGDHRHYVSRGLRNGVAYTYNLRVEFEKDGKAAVENKVVRLRAGESIELAFGGAQPAVETAQTEVKLHVPAEAKVTLAGAATEQTGELRSFSTTSLKPGEKWDNYQVRVELERDGQTLVEEQTITVESGKTYDLTFDFAGEATQVASVN